MKTKRDENTYQIIGCAMEVHRTLGTGFLEKVYHEALIHEFYSKKIIFRHEVELPILYKGVCLSTKYRVDFLCFEKVLVEIKAIAQITRVEKAQLINYLKATNFKQGLLINFGSLSLQYNRLFN